MSGKIYKIASLVLVLGATMMFSVILIRRANAQNQFDKFEKENADLRKQKEVYMSIVNNDGFSQDIKKDCKEGVHKINNYLYDDKQTDPRVEKELRRELIDINTRILEQNSSIFIMSESEGM